jgi:hypothetical protein
MTYRRFMLVACVALIASTALAQAPRKRRNIECLSTSEVATFRHAIDVLKHRDPARDNPADPLHNSYDWYASLHNGDGVISNCNHGNELFLTWHRALLIVFERALQESDPAGGTRDIMLPYWNWSVAPSGSRYPKPFEVKNDVLFANRRTTQQPARLYSTDQLEQMMNDNPTWTMFGGAPCSDSDCPAAGYGAFEQPYHNQMHVWVGGAMRSDTTAAVDPIFWVFHNYIDLIYAEWQKSHPDQHSGCADCPMRGMPEWTPRKVENIADLGYEYDVNTCGATPLAAFREAAEMTSLAKPKKDMSQGPVIVDVTIPSSYFSTAEVRVGGAEVPSTFSYNGAVYLYPATSALAPNDADFRRRYRVGEYSVWALHHHEHGQQREVDLYVNATTELRYLAKKYGGAKWKLAIVLDDVQLTDPNAKAVPLSVKSQIRFDEVSLVFDRGEEKR